MVNTLTLVVQVDKPQYPYVSPAFNSSYANGWSHHASMSLHISYIWCYLLEQFKWPYSYVIMCILHMMLHTWPIQVDNPLMPSYISYLWWSICVRPRMSPTFIILYTNNSSWHALISSYISYIWYTNIPNQYDLMSLHVYYIWYSKWG